MHASVEGVTTEPVISGPSDGSSNVCCGLLYNWCVVKMSVV